MKKIKMALLFTVTASISGLAYCQAQGSIAVIETSRRQQTEARLAADSRLLEAEQKQTPPNYFKLSRLTNDVGMDHYSLGNYAEAERVMQQALALIRNIPAAPIPPTQQIQSGSDAAAYRDIVARITFEGTYAHNLGQAYFKQKKYNEAESMFKISSAAAEADPRKTLLKEYLTDLENVYLAMGSANLAKETRSRIEAVEAKR